MKKTVFALLFISALLLFGGCSSETPDPREELAIQFVTAVAEGDEEDVWECFAPEFREKLIRELWDGDESAARSGILELLQAGMKARYDLDDTADLTDNENLFKQAVREVLYNPGEKFVAYDDRYYLQVDLDDNAKSK